MSNSASPLSGTDGSRPVAVVTGASSGIGAATARHLVDAGFAVELGARRTDRLDDLVAGLAPHARSHHLDVTDPASVEAFCHSVDDVRVLVNNAGGALGREPVAQADDEAWRTMYETNVLGVMRMTRALLPKLVASGNGHVVTIGSVAAFEVYAGGAGYIAAKHAARGVTDVLRLELVGQPVRVSEIDPGMVETEFSLVRFGGDADAAAAVYQGMTPLVADDIADVVAFVVTRPAHVDIDQVVVRPRDQARTWLVNRS
jgi:NADP-dependent 3-hydroxy acid dehydrogenase YdfG